MSYINSLTGLRGLAALVVFLSHCANQGMLPGILGNGLGQLGVMLFFVLSGFLMGHLYLGSEANGENIQRYLVARAGRIVPLYTLLILSSMFISIFIYPNFHYHITEPQILLRALMFIDAPYEFWTIPVEVQFYLVFTLFWIFYRRNASRQFLLLFVALTAVPSILLFPRLGYVPPVFSSYSFAFFVGIGSALVYPRIRNSPKSNRWANVLALPAIVAFFLNLPAVRVEQGWLLGDHFFLRTWLDPVNWIVVCTVFYCALLNARRFNFLNARPFVFLGEISFGFYLIHYPVLKIAKAAGVPVLLQFPVSFAVITFLAWLSYHYFEKPANIWMKRQLLRRSFVYRSD